MVHVAVLEEFLAVVPAFSGNELLLDHAVTYLVETNIGPILAEETPELDELLDQVEAELEGTIEHVDAPVGESPDLPTPTTLNDPADADGAEDPLPAGYRRRVDRVSLRKARKRRGR